MLNNSQQINPWTDIPYAEIPVGMEQNAGATFLSDLRELSIGDGTQVFRADEQGIWLGGKTFDTSAFSVSMAGAITASSFTLTGGTFKYGKTSFTDSVHAGYFTSDLGFYFGAAADATKLKYVLATGEIDYIGKISGRDTSVLAGAINASGVFINDVINANLDTQTKEILSNFTFGASGALKIITDANNGVWISPTGVLTKQAGVTTFALGIDGSANYYGTLSATQIVTGTLVVGRTEAKCTDANADQTSANPQNVAWLTDAGALAYEDMVGLAKLDDTVITGGYIKTSLLTADNIITGELIGITITGAVFRTATTGKRIRLSSSPQNKIEFLDNAAVIGTLEIKYSAADGYSLFLGGTDGALEICSVLGTSALTSANMPGYSFAGKASVGQVYISGSPNYPRKAGLEWVGGGEATFSLNLGTGLAKVSSHLIPSGAYNLGASANKWQNLYIDGIAYLDAISMGGNIVTEGSNVHTIGSSANPFGLTYLGQTRTRTLYPSTNNTYHLGTSSLGWDNVYCADIYRGATWLVDLETTFIAFKKPVGFQIRTGVPGAASSWKGFMYWDNNESDLVFSDGSQWHKVTATPI